MKKELNILLIASYFNIFGFGFFGPIYALYVKEIGGTILDTSLSWAIYSLVMGVLIIIFGKLEDKILNKRKMIVIGYFILAFGILSYAFVQDKTQLFIVQIINGIGVAVLNPAFKTIFSKDEDKGRESYEWSLWEGGEKIMLGTSALIGGIIVTYFGFKIMFYIMFIMQLFGALISINILSYDNHKKHKH
ncbi:MFS transporter [archaeon]|jgi:MFS family permease|nr:MFS transporter [archaeon]MBT4352204.1 MFS transporter [archaeon]MBT4647327.1 MFS transporter [archaeon]MBT6821237.1 MFS transporter [archaeon]MBT7391289.1 MFS transporter [archaeon]